VGRSATIVPDGVLFGASKAHVQLRQHLIDDNQLEAVISLPSGVFKPYAGVSTAIIVFSKGGRTENVMFYDVLDDGFSLDDKRAKIGDGKGDLPDVLAKYRQWCGREGDFADRATKAFEVSAADIRAQGYDLSINRYKESLYAAAQHDDPRELLKRLNCLEKEIFDDLQSLERLL
jgi:type I restriction enzyme M protein